MKTSRAAGAAFIIASLLLIGPSWAGPAPTPTPVPAPSSDDSCSEVRMDQGEGSVAKLPIFQQGSDGLCYSYTASQMIDAWRFSHGDTNTEALSSPVYGGAVYAKTYKKYFELASIKQEIYAKGHGKIAEAQVGSDYEIYEANLNGYTDINFGHIKATIELLRANRYTCDTRDLYGRELQQSFSKQIAPLIDLGNKIYVQSQNVVNLAESRQCSLLKSPLANGKSGFVKDLSKVIEKSENTNELVMNFLEANCPRKIDLTKVPPPQMEDFFQKPVESRLSTMHHLLSQKNPQPIGINYCSGFLFTKAAKKCEQHASIVVGRKKINGQCHFLVRNTWGKTCEMKRNGRMTKYQYPCDKNGQIWVPQEDLVRMTYSAYWL